MRLRSSPVLLSWKKLNGNCCKWLYSWMRSLMTILSPRTLIQKLCPKLRMDCSTARPSRKKTMVCSAVSRHNAIDDGAYKCGIAQIECTGHKGSSHQQPKLPP